MIIDPMQSAHAAPRCGVPSQNEPGSLARHRQYEAVGSAGRMAQAVVARQDGEMETTGMADGLRKSRCRPLHQCSAEKCPQLLTREFHRRRSHPAAIIDPQA
jgi:hypothetical protein